MNKGFGNSASSELWEFDQSQTLQSQRMPAMWARLQDPNYGPNGGFISPRFALFFLFFMPAPKLSSQAFNRRLRALISSSTNATSSASFGKSALPDFAPAPQVQR